MSGQALFPDMAIGPYAYAKSIAYMSCPSTIRQTTLRMFGRAPSIEQCTAYREAYKRAKRIPEVRIRDCDLLGDTFKCGHEREMDNIAIQGNIEICKTCLVERQKDTKRQLTRKPPVMAPMPEVKPIRRQSNRVYQPKPMPLVFSSQRIIQRACEIFDLTYTELTSKSRVQNRVRARQLCMLAIYEQGRLSTPQVARIIGVGDHSTVVHGIKKARSLAMLDGEYAWALNELRIAAKAMPVVHDGS